MLSRLIEELIKSLKVNPLEMADDVTALPQSAGKTILEIAEIQAEVMTLEIDLHQFMKDMEELTQIAQRIRNKVRNIGTRTIPEDE